MKTSTVPFFSRFLLAGAALSLCTASPAWAANATWSGTAGDGNWATAGGGGNWSGSAAPGTPGTGTSDASVATFQTAGTTITDSAQNRNLGQIVFNNTGSLGNFSIGTGTNTIYFKDSNNASLPSISEVGTSTAGLTETIKSNLMITGANGSTSNDLRISTADGFSGTIALSGNISTVATSGTSGIRIVTSGSTSSANASNKVVLSGVISDGTSATVGVSRARNGVVLITGANTFSGGFQQGADGGGSETESAITLIGVNSVLTSGTLTSGAFGTGVLTLFGGNISSDGTAARTIYNNLAFSTTGYIGMGFGDATNNGALTFTGSGTVGNPGGFSFDTKSAVTMSGILGGSQFFKTGTSTLTLSGANTYVGAMTVTAGVLNIQNNTALGTIAGSTSVASGSTLQIQNNITVGAEALSIAGTGAAGTTGALENVSGTNNYGGLITLGAATTIASDAGTLNLTNGGTLTGSGFNVTVTGPGNGSIASIIGTGAGGVTKLGTGTWTLSGANTYTGTTAVSAGRLQIGDGTNGSLGGTNATVASGASLAFNAVNNGTYSGTIANSGTVVGAEASTHTNTLSGVISGAGGFTQSGAGRTVLTGNNLYTGTTTISAGRLYANNTGGPGTSATGTGPVIAQSGGTLAGSGRVAGAVTVQSGGNIASGAAQSGSTVDGSHLKLDSTLFVAGGGNLTFALGAGPSTGYLNYASPNLNTTYLMAGSNVTFDTAGAPININLVDLALYAPGQDTLQLRYQNPYLLVSASSNLSYNLVTTGGYDQNGFVLGIGSGPGSGVLNTFNLTMYDVNGNDITTSANYYGMKLYLYNGQLEVVPEPGTWALIIGGLAALVLIQRRRRKN